MCDFMIVVPPRHQYCNACEEGVAYRDGPEPCEICQGKGYWNAEDILQYHIKYPEMCKERCGEEHIPPYLPTPEEIAENRRILDDYPQVVARAEALLAKYGIKE